MTYIGRFAPTPSGPLHLGSLFTALASYLDARHHQGRWLVRIEDLDTPRCIPGGSAEILRTLAFFGLHWDGPVLFQSERTACYQQALEAFVAQGNTLYPCTCTRRQLQAKGGGPYPGHCRPSNTESTQRTGACPLPGTATRWWMPKTPFEFEDRIMGLQSSSPATALGDPVLRRKDGLFAYHWAVVVDDALQGITDIVRGLDLISQTGIHLSLQHAADYPQPRYAHVPLVLGANGQKLSKSERANSLKHAQPSQLITKMLLALGQLSETEAADRANSCVTEVLAEAAARWDIKRIPKITSLSAQVLIA